MQNRFIHSAVILFLTGAPAGATGSLDFKAGGYTLSMAISLETNSVVGPVRFTSPASKVETSIKQSQFKALICNTTKKRFQAEFVNPGDTALPQSFQISVRGEKGVLFISGKRISFQADWVVQ